MAAANGHDATWMSDQPLLLYDDGSRLSRGPYVALYEGKVPFKLLLLAGRGSPNGGRSRPLHPLAFENSPVLEMPDGSTMREPAAILEFVADLAPHAKLAPAHGSRARAQLGEWLHFLSRFDTRREVGRSPAAIRGTSEKTLAWIDVQLSVRPFLLGEEYSIADIYLWSLTSWSSSGDIELAEFCNLHRWHENISRREAVRAALYSAID